MSEEQDARKHAAAAAQARSMGVQEYELEMAKAVPTDVVRDIVKDHYRRPGPSSISATVPREPEQQGSGWYEPAPLAPPAGQDHIERLVNGVEAEQRAAQAQGPMMMQAMVSLVTTLRLLLERQHAQKPSE